MLMVLPRTKFEEAREYQHRYSCDLDSALHGSLAPIAGLRDVLAATLSSHCHHGPAGH